MSRANSLWGAPRVHGELAKLGISISQAAVSKYMVRHRTPPSHTWRSFLDNHANDLVSLDFFTLPTATFRVLLVLALPESLRKSLATTNSIENLNGTIRRVSRNVKRWKSPSMIRRWTALGVVTAEKKFRRIKGYRHMGALVQALRSKQKSLDSDAFAA